MMTKGGRDQISATDSHGHSRPNERSRQTAGGMYSTVLTTETPNLRSSILRRTHPGDVAVFDIFVDVVE